MNLRAVPSRCQVGTAGLVIRDDVAPLMLANPPGTRNTDADDHGTAFALLVGMSSRDHTEHNLALSPEVQPPDRQRGAVWAAAAGVGLMLGAGLAMSTLAFRTPAGPPPVAVPATTIAETARCEPLTLRAHIARSEIDIALANDTLAKAARIVPRIHDGEIDGFKLYAIRPGSLWDLAGLRNGDVMRRVEGAPISALVESLPTTDALPGVLDFELVRRGCPATLTVTLE